MYRIWYAATAVFLLLSGVLFPFHHTARAGLPAGTYLTAYLSGWTLNALDGTLDITLSDINFTRLTHVIVGEINGTGAGDATLYSGWGIGQEATWVAAVKAEIAAQGATTKVLIRLYDPGAGVLHGIGDNAGLRATLVSNIHTFMNTNSLDGVDVDWEEVASYESEGGKTDELVNELAAEVHPSGHIVTIAGAPERLNVTYATCGAELDIINVMSYDMGNPAHSTYADSVASIEMWATEGFSKSRIVMGLPAYAKDSNGAVALWSDVVRELNPADAEVSEALGAISVPWVVGPVLIDGGTIWYGGVDLCEQKTQYVIDNGYAGMMVWDVGEDEWLNPSKGFTTIAYTLLLGSEPSPPAAPTNVAATDGSSTSNVTVTWTASAGATGYRVYRAGTDVSGLLGAVTTYYDTGAAAGVITPGTAAATDGTNTDNVTLTISGASVANGTTYSYTVRAVSDNGTSADSTANTGYRGVGSLTYQWWRSAADSNGSYSVMAGATTATYVDQTAPAPTLSGGTATAGDGTDTTNVNLAVTGTTASGAGRYYACAVSASGATDQTTTTDRGYRAVTGLTYQWFASSTDYDTGYAIIGGATTATWAYDAAPDPTITAGAAVASDNTSTEYVTLTLSGSAAVPGAGRWFLCQVSAGGTAANSTHNRGYVGVGTLTVQWQRSAADSDAAYGNIAGGITNPYNDSGAPSTGAGRYYKATLTATGAAGTTTTVDRGSRLTAVTVPTTGNTMSDVFGWAMVLAAVAGIFTGAKNAPRYN